MWLASMSEMEVVDIIAIFKVSAQVSGALFHHQWPANTCVMEFGFRQDR
jgi:hypothetical protein